MIIQIDGQYFNPLTITTMNQNGNDVHIWFDNEVPIIFRNWKVADLAAEINRCIEVFNKGT